MVDPLGSLGTPEGIGVLAITMIGLVVLFVPCYLGIRLGAGFATVFGLVVYGAAHPADHPAGVQAQYLSLVQCGPCLPLFRSERRPASPSS